MTKQQLHGELNVSFITQGISPVELMMKFENFLMEQNKLVNRSGQVVPIQVTESHITSIVAFDDDENEREYIDKKGKLKLTEQEIQEAIKKGLVG